MFINFYWNQFILDRHSAKDKLAPFFETWDGEYVNWLVYCAGIESDHRYGVDATGGLYKISILVWAILGLASCASVIATMQDTYWALVRRIEDKAAELKETAESIYDKTSSEVQHMHLSHKSYSTDAQWQAVSHSRRTRDDDRIWIIFISGWFARCSAVCSDIEVNAACSCWLTICLLKRLAQHEIKLKWNDGYFTRTPTTMFYFNFILCWGKGGNCPPQTLALPPNILVTAITQLTQCYR